jgi:hypothetical protein
MRGFSNRAFVQPNASERAERELEALQKPHLTEAAIAKRFAPVIVARQETISGETGLEQPIAMSWDLAKRSFAQGFRCLWNINRVLAARAKLRMKVAFHRIMQTRVLPWALAGSGWGMSMGLVMLVVVMR